MRLRGSNQQLNWSISSPPPTKPQDPSTCTQSTPLHTIPHHSHAAQITTLLLFKVYVNIILLLTL